MTPHVLASLQGDCQGIMSRQWTLTKRFNCIFVSRSVVLSDHLDRRSSTDWLAEGHCWVYIAQVIMDHDLWSAQTSLIVVENGLWYGIESGLSCGIIVAAKKAHTSITTWLSFRWTVWFSCTIGWYLFFCFDDLCTCEVESDWVREPIFLEAAIRLLARVDQVACHSPNSVLQERV